jgi:hypothetical protein
MHVDLRWLLWTQDFAVEATCGKDLANKVAYDSHRVSQRGSGPSKHLLRANRFQLSFAFFSIELFEWPGAKALRLEVSEVGVSRVSPVVAVLHMLQSSMSPATFNCTQISVTVCRKITTPQLRFQHVAHSHAAP